MRFKFGLALCLLSGDGFREGDVHAIVGWNNGLHVLRETEDGELYKLLCFNTTNNAKNLLHRFDGTCYPVFEVLPIKKVVKKRLLGCGEAER